MGDYVHKDSTLIHDYITSPRLDPSKAVQADEHGIYPINPLGFPETSFCADAHQGNPDTERECIGKASAAYPQSLYFSVENGAAGTIPSIDSIVEIGANVATLEGSIVVPVDELTAETLGTAGIYIIKVTGDLSKAVKTAGIVSLHLGNAGIEDYSGTGLLGDVAIIRDSVFDGVNTSIAISCASCLVTGHIGRGRLSLILESTLENKYALLTAQNNSSENGLYEIPENGPWIRLASVSRVIGVERVSDENPYDNPASLDNSTVCGHKRHGYSDREVSERVEQQVGHIIQNARHPMAAPGDLRGAGELTKWFIECGNVVLGSSHETGKSVIVDGFGLGGYHSGTCTYGDQCSGSRNTNVNDEMPVTLFSIGTSSNAGTNGLPRDWPFTQASDFAGVENDNNITLVKNPVHLASGGTLVGGVSNRVHVCVNNDFATNEDETTRFKKTYVHLPAPIDTKDGDEFEITVSLPTINVQNAFHEQATVADLSAYYEYVSQPRVVIMGGYWKFSQTVVEWDESSIHSNRPDVTGRIVISDNAPFVDSNGDPIDSGVRIRFTLDGISNCPRLTEIIGTLASNEAGNIIIDNMDKYPYGARMRGLHMRICGIAYLDKPEDEPYNYTDTSMGLHSRNSVTLGSDAGNGETGDLSQYNKFVTPYNNDTRQGRQSVNGTGDSRQILASVYPTTTNTFQWSVVGRNKMRQLDRLMTDEWDNGEDSISSMVWHANKALVDFEDTVDFFGYGYDEYRFSSENMPIRYGKKNIGPGKSTIGSQLRIKIPDVDYSEIASNPVRQARRAARMIADDFIRLRMYHGNRVPSVTGSAKIRVSSELVNVSLNDYFTGNWASSWVSPSADVQDNSLASAAWLIKARHLPEYVLVSGQDDSAEGNSIIGANPFVDAYTSGRYSYDNMHAKYSITEYGTSCATEEIPCSTDMVGPIDAFGYRSVISALIASDAAAVTKELYRDANRVAELQMVSIDKWNDANYDFTLPYNYLADSSNYQKWMDIYSATANVFSIDTIPIPADSAVPEISDYRQFSFLSGDPMASYRAASSLDINFVSANLPFYDESSERSVALTNLLRNMVTAYGAKMPLRFWDSTRVAFAANSSDPVADDNMVARLTRIVWPEEECTMPSSVRTDKIDDEFITRSANSATMDVNLHYAMTGTGLHMNCSAPPVKVSKDWYDQPQFTGTGGQSGPSGYIRVLMKFKFSAQAGRWYTVDYIQEPMAYLSPLYGADALDAKVNGVNIWTEPGCQPGWTWNEALMHPYFKYEPMDINPDAIPLLVGNIPSGNLKDMENNVDMPDSEVDMSRFEKPYMAVQDGGIGLSAPVNANGEPMVYGLENAVHANFWSVRKHLRPAVSVLAGTDIPGYDSSEHAYSRTGGTMGDSVLWGQFAFPKKGQVSYVVPTATDGI